MSHEGNIKKQSCIKTVISGSFRKHLPHIIQLKQQLETNHIEVLSPYGTVAINPGEEFIVLDTDALNHPRLLQDSVFAKIRGSTFLVVANFNGYMGKATVLEIGYALAMGIAIYVIEPVEDPNLQPYCKLLSEIIPEMIYTKETNLTHEFI